MKQQIIPLLIVSIVVMMIVPLPNSLLDLLLAGNLAFSIVLLLSAVSIRQPERFTILPSVLLLSTLFRLGLNVATTRQLLGNGEAPSIVEAFGHFVVGGNLVVGVVLFFILTLIQYIVISKGAERVAEVAARFTLDAMPGKQISIDADLRSGVISLAEARERRLELQRESRLYGALDGAMKFIKGDAVAGLVITLINICAGIFIGVSVHKLSLSSSAERYTIFTIGDGLISQIPALLVSIGAGLAVTRVTGKGDLTIGGELFEQITEERSVLIVTALLLLGLSCLPGLPAFPLVILSGIGAVCWLVKKERTAPNSNGNAPYIPKSSSGLMLKVTFRSLEALRADPSFVPNVQALRRKFFEKWGLVILEPELEIDHAQKDIAVKILRFGSTLEVIEGDSQTISKEVLSRLEHVLEERKLEFLDDTMTRLILESHEARIEDLINSVIPSILSVTKFTKLLKALLQEGVPVHDLAGILQGVLEWNAEEDIPAVLKSELLLAFVREKLSRSIHHVISDECHRLKVIKISHSINEMIERMIIEGVPMLPSFQSFIVTSILKEHASTGVSVVLSSQLARGAIGRILCSERVAIYVISECELLPEVNVIVASTLGEELKELREAA